MATIRSFFKRALPGGDGYSQNKSPASFNLEGEKINVNTHTLQPDFSITPGAGDLPRLTLVSPDGARLEVYLHGAHVASWIPAGGQERLFLSSASQFTMDSPIRGGIPVVFPQFGAYGPLPMHGLVRVMPWEFARAELLGDRAMAKFSLGDTETSRALWPHAFQAELLVSISGRQLEVILAVTNTGIEPFAFTSSLHTYLKVSDINLTYVKGLAGLRYRDSAAGGVEKRDENAQIDFPGEVNCTYFNAPAEVLLVDSDRSLIVRKAGFTDTVIWNPGAEKCAVVPDLEPDDYRKYVCIEAATIGEPVQLAPEARWFGAQTLLA